MRNIFSLTLGLLLLQPLLSSSQVIIYSGCQYSGTSASLGPGNYYNPFQFRLGDNSVSSVGIPAGFRVELYDNVNLVGIPTILNSGNSCLNASVNNRTSSIRVIYNSDNPWNQSNIASLKVPFGYEVDLFQYPRYQGSRTIIRGDYSCLGTAFRGRVRSMAIRRIPGMTPYENRKEGQ